MDKYLEGWIKSEYMFLQVDYKSIISRSYKTDDRL